MNGACHNRQPFCEPAIAIVRLPSGISLALCPHHLDAWLDLADNHPHLEPLNLWWINQEAAA